MPSPFTSPFTVAAAGTTVAVLVLIWAEYSETALLRWIAKPLASVGFIAAALTGGFPTTPFGIAVVAALVLSLAGDVLLIPKATAAFAAGLGSFLLGHVAYGAAFLARGVSPVGLAIAVVPIVVLAILVHRWLAPHVPDKLRLPVLAYIIVISGMVILAVGTLAAHPNRQGQIILAAAVAFFASDLAVARNRFVSPTWLNRLWGLPLYYGAQLLFAWTLVAAQ